MTHDDRDLHALRVLDPAHSPRPEAGRDPGAQAVLTRVLETPQGEPPGGGVSQIGGRRRWAAVGIAAAAVAAALVILPLGGEPQHAFATWSATPQEASTSALDDVSERCSPRSSSSIWDRNAIIAEERGRVTFVVALTELSLQHCLLVDGEFFSASSGNVRLHGADIGADEVQTYLAGSSGSSEDAYSTIMGRVGDDVIGVEIHPSDSAFESDAPAELEAPDSVTATVDSGHYGAWWPGSSDEFELTIHLADGTVLENVPAFEHDR